MSKFVAPDKGVKETVIGGRSYYADGKTGLYNVTNKAHQKAMKAEGFIEASIMGATLNSEHLGYTCTACGFGSWFRKCSRCGHEQSAENNPPRDGE